MMTCKEDRVRCRAAWMAFVLANALLLFLQTTSYIRATEGIGDFWALLFSGAAMVSHVLLPLLLLSALALLLQYAAAGRWLVRVLFPLLVACLQLAVFVDTRLYGMFRYHFNGLALNVLTTPGGFSAMNIGQGELVAGAAACIVLVAAELGLSEGLLRTERRLAVFSTGRFLRNALLVFLACVLVDRVAYATAHVMNHRPILRAAQAVPFYVPITVTSSLARVMKIPPREGTTTGFVSPTEGGILNYPRTKLVGGVPQQPVNILWLVIDSWRYDVFDAKTSPHLFALKDECQVFERHYSGGNATRFGVFSLFYGLHGSYWQNVLVEHRNPVLIDRLKDLSYQLGIFASAPLTFPEFRQTIFAGLGPQIQDQFKGGSIVDRDRRMTDAVLQFLDATTPDHPFFVFAFLDAPHSPFHFPEEDAVFEGENTSISYVGIDRGKRDRGFNSYRNAVHYSDRMAHAIVETLKDKGLWENTVLLVTGDHGQEFYEHGYWGHTGAFTPEQAQVPLILCAPGYAPAHHPELTGHQDVAATFLRMLGVTNPASDYSHGRDLLSPAERERSVVSCGWDQCALIDDDGYVVFGTQTYNSAMLEVRDRNYVEIEDAGLGKRGSAMAKLLTEMSEFAGAAPSPD